MAPSFHFIEDDHERKMYINMHNAIDKLNMWNYISSFDDNENGFMFSGDKEIMKIYKEVDGDGHSGASFAILLRHMQYIAIKGYNAFQNHKKP